MTQGEEIELKDDEDDRLIPDPDRSGMTDFTSLRRRTRSASSPPPAITIEEASDDDDLAPMERRRADE